MANSEQLKILKKGVKVWNKWRKENPTVEVDLSGADIRGMDIRFADLKSVNMIKTNISSANLSYADLSEGRLNHIFAPNVDLADANLKGADLSGAFLADANLSGADFSKAKLVDAILSLSKFIGTKLNKADLRRAALSHSFFIKANLEGANLEKAQLDKTILADTTFHNTKGLGECKHLSPSMIDDKTLIKSGHLPLSFLRGCGLPDEVIKFYQSIWTKPIQFHSCFICYSTKDREFVNKLYNDLQNIGIRTWYAPENLKIGDKFKDKIDQAIKSHDKLLLVLSRNSVNSEWVADEVDRARNLEEKEEKQILFPIRIDNTVMELSFGWVSYLRRNRHIGDFTRWKNRKHYEKAFQRLTKDLKASNKRTSSI